MLIPKTIFILATMLMLSTNFSHAQIMFQNHYGGSGDDGGNSVIQTSDGGYLVAGLTDSWGNGSKDIYLIKTNEYGDTTWTRYYGGYNWDDAVSVIEGTDSSFYLTGGYSSTWNAETAFYLMKVNTVGDSIWLKTYGGLQDDDGNDLVQCYDGGFMIIGTGITLATGFSAMYAVRTNINGDSLWAKTYEKEWANGGITLLQTSDSGFIFGGYTATGGGGTFDIYIVRTNSVGDTLWTKTYGGTSYDVAAYICETTDGNYIIVGTTSSFGSGGGDIYTIKIDTSGSVIWENTYGGIANDYGAYCAATSFGSVIVGRTESFGHGGSDAYMIAINHNGDTIWTHVYGGANDDWVNCIRKTDDGGYIMSGYTDSFTGNMDAYLIKTRTDGYAGIEQELSGVMEFNIFPNPCSEILSLSSPVFNNQNILVKISNASGSVVMETNIAKSNRNIIDIDVSSLPSGVYLLSAFFNETQISKKLIIN